MFVKIISLQPFRSSICSSNGWRAGQLQHLHKFATEGNIAGGICSCEPWSAGPHLAIDLRNVNLGTFFTEVNAFWFNSSLQVLHASENSV